MSECHKTAYEAHGYDVISMSKNEQMMIRLLAALTSLVIIGPFDRGASPLQENHILRLSGLEPLNNSCGFPRVDYFTASHRSVSPTPPYLHRPKAIRVTQRLEM